VLPPYVVFIHNHLKGVVVSTPKIYTKTGDQGTTSLVNGERVSKSHARLDCYGTVDELNSTLGVLLSELQAYGFESVNAFLTKTQNQLFNLGSQLACPDPKLAAQLPTIKAETILAIEQEIDSLMKELPPLKQFILPGGHLLSSQTHMARTICRRAERLCCTLAETEDIPEQLIPYLNRLNDYLFVLARSFNHQLGVAEVVWKKD
jgi:cob(I)alamin adenosyltransferase